MVAFASVSPAAAKVRHEPKATERVAKEKATERIAKEPFGVLPKGPLQIVVSINQQKLHLYADGTEVAETLVATGVPSLPTPTGVFSVIGKERFHRSNIYSGAPMPFMQRITWSGVALHEGENIGHPASHGCIRMPHDFAVKLFGVTKIGVRVIVAREELKPVVIADSHLFVHKVAPPAPPPTTPVTAPASTATEPAPSAPPETTKTAQNDDNKTTDAATPKSGTPAAANVTATAAASTMSANEAGKPVVVSDTQIDELRGAVAVPTPLDQPEQAAPPPPPPTTLVETAPATHGPIAIFVSRKEKKIYVRQNFTPLFYAPVAIADPDQPLGTMVFTAMDYLADGTTFRWNVVSFPGERSKVKRVAENDRRSARRGRSDEADKPAGELPPPLTPAQALARIDIPQDVIDRIAELMVPGSSLVVSDQGLGDETGEGTDFVVVTR
jgi:hypothetical protein